MIDKKPLVLKLLGIIVDRAWTQKVADILREEQVRFNFITLGEGTAGSDIMALLGLNSVDKSLICSLMPDFESTRVMRLISERINLAKPGMGIAFISPLSGVSQAAHQLIGRAFESRGDEEKVSEKKAAKYDMIIAVVNQGHTNELMAAAKSAGARGGTVLHGRKCDVGDDSKFFGISPQMEKDIVAILAKHEMKNDIMIALTQACGMNTEAQGVILSIPVDDIEGLKSVTE
jgi:hypothetical protein